MELRQLRYFVTTAEMLSFSDAARKLFISQSTLSQQVRQLEDEMGMPLFQRTTHKVVLTEAGARLLPMARKTLNDAEACMSQVRDLNDMLSGTLTIGVTRMFRPMFLDTAKKFLNTYPGVHLSVHYCNRSELIERLHRRDLDFALSYMTESVHEDIDSEVLFEDRLSVVMRKDHPLAGRSKVSVADLKGYKFALPADGVPTRPMLDRYMDVHDPSLTIPVEINSPTILLDLVKMYNYVTVLSKSIARYYPDLEAVELDVPDNLLYGCVHRVKGTYCKRSAALFMQMLRESEEVCSMNA